MRSYVPVYVCTCIYIAESNVRSHIQPSLVTPESLSVMMSLLISDAVDGGVVDGSVIASLQQTKKVDAGVMAVINELEKLRKSIEAGALAENNKRYGMLSDCRQSESVKRLYACGEFSFQKCARVQLFHELINAVWFCDDGVGLTSRIVCTLIVTQTITNAQIWRN